MKILAFTDPHASQESLDLINSLAKKEKPGLILCMGDVSIFERGMKHYLEEIDKIGIRTLAIHGNHESIDTFKKACENSKNIEFIHRKHIEIGNILFFGFGGGGLSFTSPDISKLQKKWGKVIRDNVEKKIVLMTHAPPYGAVDYVFDEHCGNKTIAKFIEKNRVDILLCGHLHENEMMQTTLSNTAVINPGRFGMIIEL